MILALAIQAHAWAVALAVPGLVLERRLISARFAALHDRGRMKGLYEVTLEANRGLRQQAVLETILEAVRRLLRSPGGGPDLRWARLRPARRADDRGRPAALAGRGGPAADEPFDEADQGLLRALAAVGTGALSNAELYQQVRFERERLSSITLNIGEGVCAIAAAGDLTFVNPAAADLIDLPASASPSTIR